MTDSLDIAKIAKLTGLTSRALRFYEARGLVRPLRSASGRRHYGPAELERLHQIMALKRAGLSLAQIEKLTAGRKLDLRALIAAQIDALDTQQRELDKAKTLLTTILSRIDRSEPIDVATFCSLIRHGDKIMTQEKWAEVKGRYMTPEQFDAVKDIRSKLPANFDGKAHNAKWKDLGARIKAALPMDPASPQALTFLEESDRLARVFIELSSPTANEGFRNLYTHFDEWYEEVDSGFDRDVFHFLRAAGGARAQQKWIAIQKRYMTEEQFAAAADSARRLPADFHTKFQALLHRISAALPMDPASAQAQAFLDEWQALTQPPTDAASPAAREGWGNVYAHFEDWREDVDPSFNVEAFRFHRDAMKAREAKKK